MKKERAAASAPIKLGQWHADFTKVKKYSDTNNVPILAVWSNGDSCGHCIMFEQCLLDSKFKTWAKTSGVAMWIGFGTDKTAADKFEGTGFKFARKDTLTMYPFVRLYWKKGKVDFCKSGGKITGDTAKGAAKLVTALKNALKNYKPASDTPAPTPPPQPEPTPATPPTLGYAADASCGGFALTVDGQPATCLDEATAKEVCDIYAKGLAANK